MVTRIDGTVSFVGNDGSLDFPWRAERDESEHDES